VTEKLYEVDSYVQTFTAQVVSCTPVPGGVGTVTTSVLVGHVVQAAAKKAGL